MNLLEISDSPFVATSLGTQAALLAAHVPHVEFMGRQVKGGHSFPYQNTKHHPMNTTYLKKLLVDGSFGAVHTFMPLNESDIGGAVDNHTVWLAHPLIANDIIPPSWVAPLEVPDHVLALSRFEGALLVAHGYKCVTYMPPFIHPEFTKPLGDKPVPPWKKDGDFMLVSVGRPTLRKNLPGLLLAMYQLVVVERLPVKLYLHASADDIDAAGQGFDLRGMVESLGLHDAVILPLFDQSAGISTAAMRDIYRGADAYVSTDLGEALGITRVEAMACGLPLIVPDHTSGPELCADSGILCATVPANAYFDGVKCKAPVISDIVDAVKWLMDNPSERETMGTAARAFAMVEYDNARTAAAWQALLDTYEIAEVRLA